MALASYQSPERQAGGRPFLLEVVPQVVLVKKKLADVSTCQGGGRRLAWSEPLVTLPAAESEVSGADATPSGKPQAVDDAKTGDYKRFGSAHPGSFNAVFAGGAVRGIRYDLSLSVFILVSMRNDRTPFSFDDL